MFNHTSAFVPNASGGDHQSPLRTWCPAGWAHLARRWASRRGPLPLPRRFPWSRLLAARRSRGTVVIVTSADLTALHASSQARKSLYITNRPSRRVLILWIVVIIPPANALQNDPTTIEPSYRWEQGGFSRFTRETNIIFSSHSNSLCS